MLLFSGTEVRLLPAQVLVVNGSVFLSCSVGKADYWKSKWQGIQEEQRPLDGLLIDWWVCDGWAAGGRTDGQADRQSTA